jgi:predicted CoA-substrate-specific enzyme activase
MALGVGFDIGTTSIKAAVVGDVGDADILARIADSDAFFRPEGSFADSDIYPVLSLYRRIKGRPLDALEALRADLTAVLGNTPYSMTFTGAGAAIASDRYTVPVINEFAAIAEAVGYLSPRCRTVFEMGGETSKYMLLGDSSDTAPPPILDYGTNGDCAAGTGSFMDQQAARLRFNIEDIGDIVLGADKAAQIAGRCSVFAKSDMIHAQQRGYRPDEVLKGLCNAVARNFKSAIVRSKVIEPPVLFIGGLAQNHGMLEALHETFELPRDAISVPELMCWYSALGAALRAGKSEQSAQITAVDSAHGANATAGNRLTLDNVTLLRERIDAFEFPSDGAPVPVYLGIDIGSVSTNLVAVDGDGHVIKEIYTRTQARPIEVVGEGLQDIECDIGARIDVRGVGTTGSGRELIGILVGADTIRDEITAHKTGALHISRSMLGREVDTIFEIGGQDSKFISIEDGVVVDFTMNDACAAGTGSFLEEQAEELGVSIVGEFSEQALSSTNPRRLGERCTVFMGRDVSAHVRRGEEKRDIIAGLANSVVLNYLNRVVRDRKVGNSIFFQGGTAYNDAVVAAFAMVTGKEITVPPHNGVVGAIGAALLARDSMNVRGGDTMFKGFDIGNIDYNLREFTCQACSNTCTIQEFTVDGEKTYWGDKCSDRYRKRRKTSRTPVVEDLHAKYETLLTATCEGDGSSGPSVGIPRAMYTYDRLPFFATYLKECGFTPVLSDPTRAATVDAGIDAVVAEPCFPIIIAHGHITELLERGVEYLWLPNVINAAVSPDQEQLNSFSCVWGMTLPYIANHAPAFTGIQDRVIAPLLHFRDGVDVVKRHLHESVANLGVSRKRSNSAVDRAYDSQDAFRSSLITAGNQAVQAVRESGEKAIVLLGRPYNVFDSTANLSVDSKLATLYGINVIPMHFLDMEDIDIEHINSNMYWNYGKKILQSAAMFADDPAFDLIYITNFKCGPDSFIKQYVRDAIGRPFLALQFDGHSNDAGMLTRLEAYLDSKGFLAPRESTHE